jgi:hypothetical protein
VRPCSALAAAGGGPWTGDKTREQGAACPAQSRGWLFSLVQRPCSGTLAAKRWEWPFDNVLFRRCISQSSMLAQALSTDRVRPDDMLLGTICSGGVVRDSPWRGAFHVERHGGSAVLLLWQCPSSNILLFQLYIPYVTCTLWHRCEAGCATAGATRLAHGSDFRACCSMDSLSKVLQCKPEAGVHCCHAPAWSRCMWVQCVLPAVSAGSAQTCSCGPCVL